MYQLSFIIPMYNEEERIERCIQSIIGSNQNVHLELEILVIDDCSTDCSSEIVRKMQGENNYISLYSNTCRQGAGYCRNIGLAKAKGFYLWFVDADDYIESDALSILKEYILQKKLDVLYFDIKRIDLLQRTAESHMLEIRETGPLSGKEMFRKIMEGNRPRVCVGGGLYRTEYINTIKLRFREGYIGEDAYFSLCVLLFADVAKYINDPIYVVHKSNNSVTVCTPSAERFLGFFFAFCDMMGCFVSLNDSSLSSDLLNYITPYWRHAKSYFRFEDRDFIESEIKKQQESIRLMYDFFMGIEYGNTYQDEVNPHILKDIKRSGTVIIYGAGAVAKEMALVLNSIDKPVLAYAVSSLKDNPKSIYGVPVIHINDLLCHREEALVVIATLPNQYKKIKDYLYSLGFQHVIGLLER